MSDDSASVNEEQKEDIELESVGCDNGGFSDTEVDVVSTVPSGGNLAHFEQFLSPIQHESRDIPSPSDIFSMQSASKKSLLRWKIGLVVLSFPVRLFTLLSILANIALVITDVTTSMKVSDDEWTLDRPSNASDEEIPQRDRFPFELADFVFSVYFMIELILRVIAFGFYKFCIVWQNDVDAFVVFGTFALSLSDLILTDTPTTKRLKVSMVSRLLQVLRFFRIIRILKLCSEKRNLERSARLMVSRNKRRYTKDGFDLDLTYVTDSVIAMSFPSSGGMSVYRNPMKEVVRFLDSKHPECYKIYNLCSEGSYSPAYFHGRVERYEIDDHNVPTVKQMMDFTKSVRCWLAANPFNVIAVHCKGGKGRTGMMICVWLVEAGIFQKAVDSLEYFGFRRTDTRVGHTFQGVDTPSQSRYVGYYERIKNNGGRLPAERRLRLCRVRIEDISKLGKVDGSDCSFELHLGHDRTPFFKTDLSKQNQRCKVVICPEDSAIECLLTPPLQLQGDVQFIMRNSSRQVPKGYLNAAFYFWFHTAFIDEGNVLRLKRQQLDNPHKLQHFGSSFAVQLHFEEME